MLMYFLLPLEEMDLEKKLKEKKKERFHTIYEEIVIEKYSKVCYELLFFLFVFLAFFFKAYFLKISIWVDFGISSKHVLEWWTLPGSVSLFFIIHCYSNVLSFVSFLYYSMYFSGTRLFFTFWTFMTNEWLCKLNQAEGIV